MTDQDLKNTCVICASNWDDFHNQLYKECKARGMWRTYCNMPREFVDSEVWERTVSIKVTFEHEDTT